jgi:hypothetical protein
VWNAKELQISGLIEAQDLVLPRFQRKSTWNAKKDFALALSFFKGLPLGTIVIKDSDAGSGDPNRYLLDGRQRWEALKGMRYPETIYLWAKAATGLRSTWTEHQVTQAFLRAVDDYFGADPSEDGDVAFSFPNSGDEADDAESPVTAEEPGEYGPTAPVPSPTGHPGLDELLATILLVHPLTTKGSRLTRAFSFQDLIDGLPFVELLDNGTKRVDGRGLREWITFRRKLTGLAAGSVDPEVVVKWLTDGKPLDSSVEAALRDRIAKEWGTISAAIRMNSQIETRLEQTVVAALVLTGTSASDDAKIFEIINTGGTKLTAAEVLSAAPQWRRPVDNPNSKLIADATDLYDAMGVEPAQGAVRWDVPATMLSRLESSGILGSVTGPTPRNDTRRFERRITLGFQLLAGWHVGKIAKDHVESLPKVASAVDWSSTAFEDVINSSLRYACEQEHFQYWNSWGFSVIDLMSDAVALNFMLSTAIDWDRKGRPSVEGKEMLAFRRNARTLLDRSIYEYCTGQWRGSSDSRIASNIATLRGGEQSVFEPVPPEDWLRLAKEIVDSGSILGSDYTSSVDSRIKLLLCYRAVIRRHWRAPDPNPRFEFDHIIPSKEYAAVPTGSPAKGMENHILNLAVLPAKLNNAKSDLSLGRVKSDADRKSLTELEDIPLEKFDLLSTGDNALELRTIRGPIVLQDLTNLREARLATQNA